MNSMRVKNLRCLVDTGNIPIKPLTFLVGANSSGKSTFLRVFPLLRQSIGKLTPTTSLILWYKQNGYVDFGTIKEALRDSDSAQAISFEFELTLPKSGTYEDYGVFSPPFGYNSVQIGHHDKLKIEIELIPPHTQISKLMITLGTEQAILVFNELGQLIDFKVNTRSVIKALKPLRIKPTDNFIPIIFEKHHDFFLEYGTNLVKLLPHRYPQDSKRQNLFKMMLEIGIGHPNVLIQEETSLWKKKILPLNETDENIQLFRDISFACHVPLLLSYADRKIVEFASKVQYLGPSRAVENRYYRVQDMSVEEIDFRGENLPMYLDSLLADQQAELNEWLTKYFGIQITIKNQGTHLQVMISEKRATLKNLADVGFGYSEIIAVLIKLWMLQNQSSLQRLGYFPSLIAIEQPELHLHPQLQAQLANVFADIVNMKSNQTRFLVETHGEAILNRIGQLIEDGTLSRDNVQVVLFDPDTGNGGTKVSISQYNKEGCLVDDWPYGFFLPDLD